MMKDDPDFRKHNQQSEAFVANWGELQAEIDVARDRQKAVMADIKSRGFQTKVLRAMLRDTERDRAEVEAERETLELHETALRASRKEQSGNPGLFEE